MASASPDDSSFPPASPPETGGNRVNKKAKAKAKAKGEPKQSLWKRARETLGVENLKFLDNPEDQAPDNANSSTKDGKPKNKRREQVRHAQRTHRQRTNNYIKELEKLVNNLKDVNAKLKQENSYYKQMFPDHETMMNPDLTNFASASDVVGNQTQAPEPWRFNQQVSYRTDHLTGEMRLHVDIPSPSDYYSDHTTGNHSELTMDVDGYRSASSNGFPASAFASPSESYGAASPSQFSSYEQSQVPPVQNNNTFQQGQSVENTAEGPNDIGTEEIGMNFVLSLEKPCMAHIAQHGPEAATQPTNHELMFSAPIIANAPTPIAPNSQWAMPKAELRTLLQLSSTLHIEGEITPVEAWHLLRRHPGFRRLTERTLSEVQRRLAPEIQCHGFGAVINQARFEQILQSFLPASQRDGNGQRQYGLR